MNDYPEGAYAVIFTSTHTDDEAGYGEAAQRMDSLAAEQPGYLGISSVREGKVSTTVSYWATEADARCWGQHPEHKQVQQMGRERWYGSFSLQVARIERGYNWKRSSG